MRSRAVDRLEGELDAFSERLTMRIIEVVPGYAEDDVARAILQPYIRVNLDQAIRALRGIRTEPSTAEQFALADAIVTGLSLKAVQQTFVFARDEVEARLRALADDDEDLAEPLRWFREAFDMVYQAITAEFLATRARVDGGAEAEAG